MADVLPEIPGFAVESEIGRGGMGVVYRVRRERDGATLALKMILRGRGASFAELARFRVEAEALACLNHPNIVKIRDVGVYLGHPYFTMDFAERGSLKAVVADGPRPAARAAGLVRTLALAMEHAHGRAMLHRDLKPANVLLTADGTPIVSDFGLVKFAASMAQVSEACCTVPGLNILDMELFRFAGELAAQYRAVRLPATADAEEAATAAWELCASRTGVLDDRTRLRDVQSFLTEAHRQAGADLGALEALTNDGAIMGSPHYMAPEQAAGNHAAIGPRTDVYALGGILYELLTGRPPFRARGQFELFNQVLNTPPTPPRQLVPGVPRELEAVCLRCLEKTPDARYRRAADLADALSVYLDSDHEAAAPVPAGSAAADSTPSSTRSWWPFGRGE